PLLEESGYDLAGARGPTTTEAEACPHLLELLVLFGREDLAKLVIDFFLQSVQLLLLFGLQIQHLLDRRRQHLPKPASTEPWSHLFDLLVLFLREDGGEFAINFLL